MCFFLMSQDSPNPKMRFLGQMFCFLARGHTHRQTDMKVNAEDTLSGIFLIIQDWSNITVPYFYCYEQNFTLSSITSH